MKELSELNSSNLEKIYQPTEPTGCWKRSSDNTLIKQLTKWEPDTPLLEGLTSAKLNLCDSHFSDNTPSGIFEFNII